MKFISTHIEGLMIIEPKIFGDQRGYFFESYHEKLFVENGIQTKFVQDNQSKSNKNVLRGLHFQSPPFAQAKLVRVTQGAVLDVAVDIRKNSKTYGQHVAIELNEYNQTMFFIPEGFAHGFLTLVDNTIFQYKCSAYYAPSAEKSLFWNDKQLDIKWNIENPIVSQKDQNALSFKDFLSEFK
jgi:dTDP-4-dehydrorhamnose 3,5-epimerase